MAAPDRISVDDPELGLFAGTAAAREIERLRRAIATAMSSLSNGDVEGGLRVLRQCFWGMDK